MKELLDVVILENIITIGKGTETLLIKRITVIIKQAILSTN